MRILIKAFYKFLGKTLIIVTLNKNIINSLIVKQHIHYFEFPKYFN